MTPVLAAQGVTVTAGGKTLIDRISLSLKAGERVALVGPNGAGKSTLMRALAGELRPHAGSVALKGRDVAAYSPRVLALHRAVLSQNITITFPFTVAEVAAMGAGDRRGAKVDHLVADALADVDLAGFADRIITTLSGGEQQRAHFARILVQLACGEAEHGPGVLLLDEPTASLDLRHQIDVLKAVTRCAARGVTVVAVLHDLNLASLYAERIVALDRGRVAADGAPHATITDDLLERVFGVTLSVGRAPAAGTPFVLPHMIETRAP
jgi:iron complex transport system ATP-binding protein